VFDQVLSLCGQLEQFIFFCTHHFRKLDLNIVTEYEILAFGFPNKMDTKLERREIRVWFTQGPASLASWDAQEPREWGYVLYDDPDEVG